MGAAPGAERPHDTVSELPPLFEVLPPELAMLTTLDRPATFRALAEQVDWARMPDLARYHRLDGRLALAIDAWAGDVPAVPAEVREALDVERRRRRARFDRDVLPQLEEVCSALVSAGIQPTLLKGAALVCAGVLDGGTRPMADLDLLVARSDVTTAARVLGDLGYAVRAPASAQSWARANHYQDPAWYHPQRPLGVEVHWDLQVRRHRLWFEPGTLETVDLVLPSGLHVRRLNDRDLLTHLGLHFWNDRASGGSGALGQLWDLRLTSPDADHPLWGALHESAVRRGHQQVLATVLACSRLLLGGPAPDGFPAVAARADSEMTRSFAFRRILAPRPAAIQLVMVTPDVDYRAGRLFLRLAAQLRKPLPLLREAYGTDTPWRLRVRHAARVMSLLLELAGSPIDTRSELRLDRWAHRLR
jgi:hypothetical protein